MAFQTLSQSRHMIGQSCDSVLLIPEIHGFAKQDLPMALRLLERWLGPMGVLPIVFSGLFLPRFLVSVASILGLCACAFFLVKWTYARECPSSFVPSTSAARNTVSRLTCYGALCELQPLVHLRGRLFGPTLFVAHKHTVGLGLRDAVPSRLIAIEGAKVLVVLGLWWCQAPIIPIVAVSLILFVAHPVLFSQARTRYLRVAPQRLEVLEFWVWRTRPSKHLYVDLSRSNITCHYGKQELSIDTETGVAKPFSVDLRDLDMPHAFVQCVFQAAICSQPAPVLPNDALVG